MTHSMVHHEPFMPNYNLETQFLMYKDDYRLETILAVIPDSSEAWKDNACHRFEMTLTSSSSVTINLSLNKSDLNFNFILFKKDVLEATGIMLLNDENFLRIESSDCAILISCSVYGDVCCKGNTILIHQNWSHWTGFEPAREDPKWFLITRLNHSAISA